MRQDKNLPTRAYRGRPRLWSALCRACKSRAPLLAVLAALAALPLQSTDAAEQALSWTEPTQYQDATPLDPAVDLDRYEVDWGCTAPGVYSNTESLPAPATGYTVTGLPEPATCYFVVRACDDSQLPDPPCSQNSGELTASYAVPLGPVSNLVVTWAPSPPPPAAATYLGAVSVTTDNTPNQSITVPAGATFALLQLSAWDGGGGTVAAVSLDGQAPNVLNDVPDGPVAMTAYMAWFSGFSEGAVDLGFTWTPNNGIAEGAQAYLTFWSGVSLANPIIDSAFARGRAGDQLSISLNALSATDAHVLHATRYGGNSNAPNIQLPPACTETEIIANESSNIHRGALSTAECPAGVNTVTMNNEYYSVLHGAILRAGN